MASREGRDVVRADKFGPVELYGDVTFGATGAVASVDSDSFAVARTATGRYTVTTTEKSYYGLLHSAFAVFNNGTVTDAEWQEFTEYVKATGVLVLSHLIAGIAADPPSGTKVRIKLTLKRKDV